MIKYVVGDATLPKGSGIKMIVHCCNNQGAWGAGFVLALSKRWPKLKTFYQRYIRKNGVGDRANLLGEVQFIQIEEDIYVANLIGQTLDRYPYIKYYAFEDGFERVAEFARYVGCSVHMPRIGCGIAGGSWGKVSEIIERKLFDLDVTVYDFDGGK